MKTYKVCSNHNFSENLFSTKPVMLNKQLSIAGVEPPPLTTLFKERSADNRFPFDQYFIEHEKIEPAHGRTGTLNFQHYIHCYAIQAFHQAENSLLFLSGKKKALNDLIRHAELALEIQPLYIDLNKLQEIIEHVQMVWFRFFDGELSSTSFHGDNIKKVVDQQDLFRRGCITSMSVTIAHEGKAHPLMISHDGTICLQARYKNINEELEFLDHLYRKYLRNLINKDDIALKPPTNSWRQEILDEFEETFDPSELLENSYSII